jgi:hypothetical protein
VFDPVLHGLRIPLARVSRRPLERPVHRAQDLPHMARMILHAGQSLDHRRHARQCPEIGLEAVGAGALAQRGVEVLQLSPIQPGFAARAARASQSPKAPAPPLFMPPADALTAHLQSSSDGCQDQLATCEQPSSLFAPLLQRLKVTSGR